MKPEELKQISEESDAQVKNLGLVEYAVEILTELNEILEDSIKESEVKK